MTQTNSWIVLFKKVERTTETQISGSFFTPKQVDVISCYVNSGISAKKIAPLLNITLNTIENHTRAIYGKMGIHCRSELTEKIEGAPQHTALRDHYLELLVSHDYLNCLKSLEAVCQKKWLSLKVLGSGALVNRLKKDCRTLNISLRAEKQSPSIEVKSFSEGEYILSLNGSSFDTPADRVSYEVAFFSILKVVDPTLSPIIDPFLEKHKNHSPSNVFNRLVSQTSTKRKYAFYATMVIFLASFVLFSSVMPPKETISNLSLLSENKILMRPSELEILDNLFKKHQDANLNPVVGIVGIGGAGKTTLARLYAHKVKKSFVWELDAQSIEALNRSIDLLAHNIGNLNKDLKEEYRFLTKISEEQERIQKLIQFIKRYLKINKDWILIYDDMKVTYSDLDPYLFIDQTVCGKGRLIITTRNHLIKNALGSKKILIPSYLGEKEKRQLFQQILGKDLPPGTEEVLQALPPFPLDISQAAHYIILKDITPQEYLKRVRNYDAAFLKDQNDMMRSIGSYSKTRQSNFSMSIEDIIQKRYEFKEMLFLIALIGNQDIPVLLLEKKYSTLLVEDFIQTLKKHSFIIHVGEKKSIKVFSIHESFQESLLPYFKTVSKQEQKNLALNSFQILQNILIRGKNIWNSEHIHTWELLEAHMRYFFNYACLFSKLDILELKILLVEKLTVIDRLKEGVSILLKAEKEAISLNNPEILVYLYFNLGYVKTRLRENVDGIKYMKKTLHLMQHYNIRKPKIMGRALAFLGFNYRTMGHYEKAIDYEKKALQIFQENKDTNQIAWAKSQLSWTYGEAGQYELAERFIMEAKQVALKEKDEYHISFYELYWARILVCNGKYVEALPLLKKCYRLDKDLHGNPSKFYALTNTLLGISYGLMQKFEQAHKHLDESHTILYQLGYKDTHENATVYQCAGIVYFLEGKFNQAKENLEQAIRIFSRYNPNHPIISSLRWYLDQIEESTSRAFFLNPSGFVKNNKVFSKPPINLG